LLGEEPKVAFVHPISGRAENSSAPTLPAGDHAFPSQADAEQWISDIKPDWNSEDPKTLFLRTWRLWSDLSQHRTTARLVDTFHG